MKTERKPLSEQKVLCQNDSFAVIEYPNEDKTSTLYEIRHVDDELYLDADFGEDAAILVGAKGMWKEFYFVTGLPDDEFYPDNFTWDIDGDPQDDEDSEYTFTDVYDDDSISMPGTELNAFRDIVREAMERIGV